MIQKILIAGAGGVGGYIGAQLIRNTSTEVYMLARGHHLQSIKSSGLKIIDNDKSYTVQPSVATDNPSELGIFDLIIVAVKATTLDDTLKQLQNNIDSHTVIIPLLNGVAHDETIRRSYPQANVLDGHIYILSNIIEPGTIRRKGNVLRLVWGSTKEIDENLVLSLNDLFNQAGIRHKHSDDIRLDSWKKYLFISSFATLTSRYGKSMDEIYTHHMEELVSIMEEIIQVANAKNISLSQNDIQTALTQASKVAPGAKTSMQIDIASGKPSEIESLCGYVVKEAEIHGVDVPYMKEVYLEI